jgi:hypothetical protein
MNTGAQDPSVEITVEKVVIKGNAVALTTSELDHNCACTTLLLKHWQQ